MGRLVSLLRWFLPFRWRRSTLEEWVPGVFLGEDAPFALTLFSRWGTHGPSLNDGIDIRPLCLTNREGFFRNASLFFPKRPVPVAEGLAVAEVFCPPTGTVTLCLKTGQVFYRPSGGPAVFLAESFRAFLSRIGIEIAPQDGISSFPRDLDDATLGRIPDDRDRSVATEFYREWVPDDAPFSVNLADSAHHELPTPEEFLRDAVNVAFFCPPVKLRKQTWLIGGSTSDEDFSLAYERITGRVLWLRSREPGLAQSSPKKEPVVLAGSFRSFVEALQALGWKPPERETPVAV